MKLDEINDPHLLELRIALDEAKESLANEIPLKSSMAATNSDFLESVNCRIAELKQIISALELDIAAREI